MARGIEMKNDPDGNTIEMAGWDAINDITNQLIDVMDSLVEPDANHVMARRALARTIASMRSEKSYENEEMISKKIIQQMYCFRVLDAGIIA